VARRVFYSFEYKPDCHRAALVRNMGVVDGNKPATDNDWESVTRGGAPAIQRWIAGQMNGTSCTVVLIGSTTADRKWINHEIVKSWNDRKGVVGVYIHGLRSLLTGQSTKGANPFDYLTFGDNGPKLSSVVKTYDPPHWDGKQVYSYIQDNLSAWIEEAIKIRSNS
jgi:hypothetical protein